MYDSTLMTAKSVLAMNLLGSSDVSIFYLECSITRTSVHYFNTIVIEALKVKIPLSLRLISLQSIHLFYLFNVFYLQWGAMTPLGDPCSLGPAGTA